MKTSNKGAFLAAAVAGLFLSGAAIAEEAKSEAEVECHGVNACKGTGACAGAGHACGGQNGCKGQGFIKTTAEKCKEMGGEVKG